MNDNAPQRLYQSEVNSLFALFALRQEVNDSKETLEKRLRSIPNGWRDLKMVLSVLDKLIDRIKGTIPEEKLGAIARNLTRMSWRVYMAKPVNVPPDEVVVAGPDLDTMIYYAHEANCVACDGNCDKCGLGKALDRLMIQTRKRGESWSYIDMDSDATDTNTIKGGTTA